MTDKLRSATGARQWRSTADVTDWFKGIEEKERHSFLVFDIVNFYPSITKELLLDALNFAQTHDAQVSQDDIDTVMHARKSLLFSDGQVWSKQGRGDMFDVTMDA
eukprot:scpid83907/ scgid27036/ 